MAIEVRVPTLGESVTEATIATWFKKPGDTVHSDEMLCELETDKVTVEVPSPIAGKLQEVIIKEGETVGVDALLAIIVKEEDSNEEILKQEIQSSEPDDKNKPQYKDIEDAPSAKKNNARK